MSIDLLKRYNSAITKPYEEVKKADNLSLLKFKEMAAKVGEVAAAFFAQVLLITTMSAAAGGLMLAAVAVTLLVGQFLLAPIAAISPELAAVAFLTMYIAFSALFIYLMHPLFLSFIDCLSSIDQVAGRDSRAATQNYQQAERRLQQALNNAKTTWKVTEKDRDNLLRMHLKAQDPKETDFSWKNLPLEIRDEIAGYVLGCDPLAPTP